MSTVKLSRFTKACEICYKKCYSYPQYKAHKNEHLSCLFCGYDGDKLREHLSEHHIEDICPLCGEVIDEKMAKHIHNHFRVPFPCPYDECDKSYLQEVTLANHIRNFHLKAYEYTCEECGKSFAHKNNYEYHIDAHRRKKSGKAKKGSFRLYCKNCDKGPFKRLFDYYKHLEKAHSNLFPSVEEYLKIHPNNYGETELTRIAIIEEITIQGIREENAELKASFIESEVENISPETSRPTSPLSKFNQRQYI